MGNYWHYTFPTGSIGLAQQGGSITALWMEKRTAAMLPGLREEESPLLQKAAAQLGEYFAGKRRSFALPLAPVGSPFQQRVWQALLGIPYGETRSYKSIAIQVACPKGYRAVGLANNRNPIAIFIPCHRVLGASGSLTGFAYGLHIKRQLLSLEGVALPQGK